MIGLVYAIFWLPFIVSLFLLGNVLSEGAFSLPLFSSLFGLKILSAELTFDTLSTLMLSMISLLVGVCAQFSFHYLDKQKRRFYFYINFIGLAFGVCMMITASNLVYVLASWIIQSYFLSKLLLYNQSRFQAKLAVKKKFWISRIGDISLIASIMLLIKSFGTLSFEGLAAAATQAESQSILAQMGVFFLCLGALVKTVQFPFHIWLPETMETPAPVSAIMHAGIVNSGGFLMIRSSPILQHFGSILVFVAFIGAISAVFGSLVMITQNDIKKKLAYSTISQMGMMVFACGIGAFSIALIHIIAHSLYKSYAFLSTGNLIAESQLIPYKPKPWDDQQLFLLTGMGVLFISTAAIFAPAQFFSLYLYGSIIGLGLIQCLRASYNKQDSSQKIPGSIILMFLGGFGFYVLIESYLASHAFGFVSIANFAENALNKSLLASTLLLFLCGFVLNQKLIQSKSGILRRIYHVLQNGAYIGHISTRMIVLNKKGETHV
ncbi:MAG: proton-conducting transporter membrane subunit [Oligoflexales bacterium]